MWYQRAGEQRFQRGEEQRCEALIGSAHSLCGLGTCLFVNAEAMTERVFTGHGLGKRMSRAMDRRRWADEGRRVRCGPRRGTSRDSIPKTEMEEPILRALATERLAEREARIET